ncbi:MAG TPA: hypothetical protein VEJ84_16605, partial [Acidimicrobiales bacterium]|nr:hypothetical protein [Acidimicrobiales bacterium]
MACLIALCLFASGAASSAYAGTSDNQPPPAPTIPPIPGLFSKNIQPDPWQAVLESDLDHFISSDYDNMVDWGCPQPLTDYFAAAHYDDLLRRAFDSMRDAQFALTTGELSAAALIAARVAQASGEVAVFLATAPAGESALALWAATIAARSPELAGAGVAQMIKRVGDLIVALAKDFGQGWALTVTYSSKGFGAPDLASALLNGLGTLKASLSLLLADAAATRWLSTFNAGALRRMLSVAKTAWDVYRDWAQWQKDKSASLVAFTTAWYQYQALLEELKETVRAMQYEVSQCKPAQLPGPGPIPPDGLTQSRCGPMSGPHTVDV